MQWFALLIPILVIAVAHKLYPKKIVWFEIVIPLLVSLIIIPLITFLVAISITSDYERFGNYATIAEYIEDWNERVSCRHPKYKTVTRNGKSETVQDGYQHFYDVDHHPPKWILTDNSNCTHYISQQKYIEIKNSWGNENFQDLNRSYHSNDGDKYVSSYPGVEEILVKIFTTHRFENRILANKGVYHFEPLTPKEVQNVYQYPKVGFFNDPAVLTKKIDPNTIKADVILQNYNAKFGATKQIRIWFLIFDKDRSIVELQKRHWFGGKKNELVVCVGKDWQEVFCWSPDNHSGNEELKILIRNFKGDLPQLASFATEKVSELWKRKPFEEFNYLSVDIPFSCIIFIYFIVLVVSIICTVIVVSNDVSQNNDYSRRYY